MKNLFVFIFVFIGNLITHAQELDKIPAVQINDVNGNVINTAEYSNGGSPMIINFWATWCSPCKRELNAIHRIYPTWKEETGVKLIAVSVDDERTSNRVKQYVEASQWEFEVWLDPTGIFKNAMNVNNVPHTVLIDGNGKIVYVHSNYVAGDEDKLYEEILKLVRK